MIFDVKTVKTPPDIRGDHPEDVQCDACFARLQLHHSVPVLHQYSSLLSFHLLYSILDSSLLFIGET